MPGGRFPSPEMPNSSQQFDETLDGARVAADMFGESDGIFRCGDEIQSLVDAGIVDGMSAGDFIGLAMIDVIDLFHHAFERNADQHRAHRRFHGDAHGALDGRRQQFRGRNTVGPLDAAAQKSGDPPRSVRSCSHWPPGSATLVFSP